MRAISGEGHRLSHQCSALVRGVQNLNIDKCLRRPNGPKESLELGVGNTRIGVEFYGPVPAPRGAGLSYRFSYAYLAP